MSTLNNKTIYLKTPYIQNQLIYNLPLQVYSSDGLTITNYIKIQPLKQNNLGLVIKVGNELIQGVNFNVTINNTANGIIITLFENIAEAEELEVFRYTNPQSTTEYSGQIQTIGLKQALNLDITNSFNGLQEHEKLIQALRTDTSKYSDILSNQDNAINTLQQDLITHTHRASSLIFDSIPNNEATTIQEAIENNTLLAVEAQRGNIDRGAVRVASFANIDRQNVAIVDGLTLVLDDRVLLGGQTNPAENGVYVHDGINTLSRDSTMNTILSIQGSRVQIEEGTYIYKEYKLIIANLQGILETEPIKVEEMRIQPSDNSVNTSKLAPQPAETVIANITNALDNPTYVNKQDFKTFLEINNIDNTSDLNKPISTATQNALDLKVAQTDFDDLNTYTVTNFVNIQTAIGDKQDIIPSGGDNQYFGWNGGIQENKTFTPNTVGLDNVDNTRDVDKPISDLQGAEFDKTFRYLGNITNYSPTADLDAVVVYRNGSYLIPQSLVASITTKPAGVDTTQDAFFKVISYYDNVQFKFMEQFYIDKFNVNVYHRVYSTDDLFTPWVKLSTGVDIQNVENDIQNLQDQIDGITAGTFGGTIYTQAQVDALLATKENLLPTGTNNQWIMGDKQLKNAITANVIEDTNLYFTQTRVRNTSLMGYMELNTTTLETDTIIQALGKKLDRNVNATPAQIGLVQMDTGATTNIVYDKTQIDNKFLEQQSIYYRARKLDTVSISGSGLTNRRLITNINTIDLDNTGSFANSKFTAPVKGIYKIIANITGVGATSDGTTVELSIFKNTVIYQANTSAIPVFSNITVGINCLISLNQGDYIEFYVDSQRLYSLSGIQVFEGHLIQRLP